MKAKFWIATRRTWALEGLAITSCNMSASQKEDNTFLWGCHIFAEQDIKGPTRLKKPIGFMEGHDLTFSNWVNVAKSKRQSRWVYVESVCTGGLSPKQIVMERDTDTWPGNKLPFRCILRYTERALKALSTIELLTANKRSWWHRSQHNSDLLSKWKCHLFPQSLSAQSRAGNFPKGILDF